MPLNSMDWIVIVGYLLINLLIGIYYRRRASGNTEEFFVSGRDVSWWLAGTSMVATTFAADTPLFVCGVIATQGIAGNWLWWSFCIGGMMTVFFFARYWRRAQILTDVELTEIRYGGKPAAFLRGFKATYLGLFMNCLILGWVTNAMVSIIAVLLGPLIEKGRVVQLTLGSHTVFQTTLGDPSHTALLICIFVLIPFTGIYTAIGGLWGVLVTDLFQFILKMTMVIVLAWVALSKIGGIQALKLQLQVVGRTAQQGGAHTADPTAFLPDFHLGWTTNAVWTVPLIAFFVYLAVQWWSAWYPGGEPGGGGYVAQRMFSAKDEKHSLGATLWFNLAHYALRPWPWIITGLVALAVYAPGGIHPNPAYMANPQEGYVMVLRDYLPAGSVDRQRNQSGDDPRPWTQRIMRQVEPEGCAERVLLVLGAEHALGHVPTPTRLAPRIPGRPPLHCQVNKERDQRHRPNGIGSPAKMEVRQESCRISGMGPALLRCAANHLQLQLERLDAADLT